MSDIFIKLIRRIRRYIILFLMFEQQLINIHRVERIFIPAKQIVEIVLRDFIFLRPIKEKKLQQISEQREDYASKGGFSGNLLFILKT